MLIYKSTLPQNVRQDAFRFKQDVFWVYMQDKATENGWQLDWNNTDQEKWFFTFDIITGKIEIENTSDTPVGGRIVYFQDYESINSFLGEHHDKILKYYFELEIEEVKD